MLNSVALSAENENLRMELLAATFIEDDDGKTALISPSSSRFKTTPSTTRETKINSIKNFQEHKCNFMINFFIHFVSLIYTILYNVQNKNFENTSMCF